MSAHRFAGGLAAVIVIAGCVSSGETTPLDDAVRKVVEPLTLPGPYVRATDLTASTGVTVTGTLAAWSTPQGTLMSGTEQLAAIRPDGRLAVFHASVGQPFVADEATPFWGTLDDQRGLVGWASPSEPLSSGCAAAVTRDRHLVVYCSSGSTWWSIDVTAATGGIEVAHVSAAWKDGFKNQTESVAAVAPSGALVVFSHAPSSPWTYKMIGSSKLAGPVTAWKSASSQRIAGVGTGGEVLVFSEVKSTGTWKTTSVTAATGVTVRGSLGSWISSDGTEHLAGTGVTGEMVVFTQRPFSSWSVVDPNQIPRGLVSAAPAATTRTEDGHPIALLAARSTTGELFHYWHRADLEWQLFSVTETTGVSIAEPPVSWIDTSGEDRAAALGADGHLWVFDRASVVRRLTDDLQKPFQTLAHQKGVRRTVTILWSPEDPGVPNPYNFAVAEAASAMTEIGAFFREQSGGRLDVQNVATLGRYSSLKGAGHYWDPHDGGDGWLDGDVEKWAEAIRTASSDFDFSAYDDNGDGVLQREELQVVIMIPNPWSDIGFVRTVDGQQFPTQAPLVVHGVQIPLVTEVYVHGSRPSVPVIAHELSHALFDHADQYLSFHQPYQIGSLSLMDWARYGHHDAFSKMKLGWLKPRIVFHPGDYDIGPNAGRGEARVVLHPTRGTNEYLLFENRRPRGFDRLPFDGLVVHHVMEDPALYGSIAAPPNVAPTDWATLPPWDWGHRAIRVFRGSLWYAPATTAWSDRLLVNHPLLADDPSGLYPSMHWADEVPAPYDLTAATGPRDVMSFRLDAARPFTPPPAFTPRIAPTTGIRYAGAKTPIDVEFFPGNLRDWITIVEDGAPPNTVGPWAYTDGATSGTLARAALNPSRAGTFRYRAYANDSFALIAESAPFTVRALTAEAWTDRPRYTPGQAMRVDFVGLPGEPGDWISIAEEGSTSWGAWKYVSASSGSEPLFAPSTTGRYRVRLYANDSSVLAGESRTFEVQ